MDKAMEVCVVLDVISFCTHMRAILLHACILLHTCKPWILPVADLCVACPLLDPSARFVRCCILREKPPADLTTIVSGPPCTKPCLHEASNILARPSNWRDFGHSLIFTIDMPSTHALWYFWLVAVTTARFVQKPMQKCCNAAAVAQVPQKENYTFSVAPCHHSAVVAR